MVVSAKLHLAGTAILLGLLFLSAAHSAIYYVKPNSTISTCPHSPDPCLTLTEYGQNYDQHFNVSDIELTFLPGLHILDVSVTVANIQHVKFLGSSSSTEVLCAGNVGIVFENVSGLTIDGLMFTSCGRRHSLPIPYFGASLYGLFVDSVQQTTITNCTFQNSSGTALAVVNSSAVLGNTSFLDNGERCSATPYSNICYRVLGGGILVDKSSLNFTGTTLLARNMADLGGGIYIDNISTVTFSGSSTFVNNSVSNPYFSSVGGGGGISAWDHSTVNMNGNTTFESNSADYYGGGICAVLHTIVNMNGNTTFESNSAVGYGGGIYAFNHATVNMNENTTFIHNSATLGGGIYAFNHTIVNMNGNTTFESNSADGYGGGIFAYIHTIVNKTGTSTFISNFGGDGGGIFASNGSTIYLKGYNHFWRNRAGNGGGIAIAHNSTLTITEHSSFVNNHALGTNTSSLILDSTFGISTPNIGGGGIAAVMNSTLTILGYGSFEGNWGHNGGAIGVEESVLRMKGNHSITKCSADVEGGGVYMKKSNVTFIGDTVIHYNKAMKVGGGVYALHSTLAFPDSANFVSNSAVRGGGIYSSFSQIEVSICEISNNSAQLDGGGVYSDSSTLWFSRNSSLNNNQAQIGAGIYLDNSTMNLTGNSDVEENVASFYGAGIYTRRTLLTLTGNNALRRNTAIKNGGGIYATANSTLNFNGNNILFADSVAKVSGGAVWLDNSILKLDYYVSFRNCTATYEGGAIFAHDSHVKANGKSVFISNSATKGGAINIRWSSMHFYSGSLLEVLNNSAVTGGGIFSDNSTLEFNENCTFKANLAYYSGAGIWAARSNLSFFGTSYFRDNQAMVIGGGIYARQKSQITLCGVNNLEDNLAERGGGVGLEDSTLMDTISSSASCFASHYSTATIAVNSFNTNRATTVGGGIYTLHGILMLQGKNMFNENDASMTGGGVYAFDSGLHFPGDITFTNNSAVQDGGGLAAILCKMVNMSGFTSMKWNSARSGGAMYIDESIVQIGGINYFHDNKATSEGGVIYMTKSSANILGTSTFKTSMADERGGSIFTTSSNLTFNGDNLFQLSVSQQGAAICASHSDLTFQGNITFMNNTANFGGAIQLLKSNLVFANHSHHTTIGKEMFCSEQRNHQRRSKSGDGIGYGNNFVNNTALQGGAVYLDQFSKFDLHPASPLCFKDNVAKESGGAIYVADVIGQYLDGLSSPFRNECFFHILIGQQSTHLDLQLSFENNSAGKRGSVLYGGLLNKCDFSSLMPNTNSTSAVDIFSRHIRNDCEHSKPSPISSDPTQICFCSNNETYCAERTQKRSVFHGERFYVSVLAVDQANIAIPTIFQTNLNHDHNVSYVTTDRCTYREYSFTSTNHTKQIMIYPSSVSGETEDLAINITLKDCPHGFDLLNDSGKCECDDRLQEFTNDCDINQQAIWRTGTFWVGVLENNGTYDGLILHGNCPLNYCARSKKYIHLNDSSEQCDFNRIGLLCGQCREGESSILGSSQCRRCGNEHLFLLVLFAIAGVSLVILLFLLNLTVAAGTIHGLIFYANIIASNHHIFLSQDQSKIFTVFIAWLNLDFGIETCFYNGMDTFSKTCLQFIFPLYVWALVGALVFISHHSLLVSKLLGTNTIPVLATLFFLSYAKILRIILVALSLTSLQYPSREEIVWLYDANIPRSWYIPLTVVAALFLLFLFLPYTLLLLLGQWLQAKSHFWILSWANNLYVKAFLDAYHAPYKLKHRYWTGMLLLLRCGLYLVFAFNVTGESSINLLVISLAVLGVMVILLLTGRVYKNWSLYALEVSFIVNLGFLAAAVTVLNQRDDSQVDGSQVASYISISVAFLTFLGILLYHIYLQIKSLMRKYKCQIHCHADRGNLQPEDQDLGNQSVVAPTRSFVQLREPLDLLDTNTP